MRWLCAIVHGATLSSGQRQAYSLSAYLLLSFFWQNMLSSLQEFFRGALLPELVLRRVQRGLQLDGSDIDMSSLLEAMEVDDLEDS